MVYVLFNPLANNGRGEEASKGVSEFFKDRELSFVKVLDINDYSEFFGGLNPDDQVVLCGGDGTINRFVNATYGMDYGRDILYYACGNGNDFLNDLGLKAGCAPFAINKYIVDLPTVIVNGETYRFINGIGYGIDGYCCEEGDRQKAVSDKPVNYTSIAIKGLLGKYKRANATVTVDGDTFVIKKAWYASTMNGRYYGGGMNNAPDQDRLNAERTVTFVSMHGGTKLGTLMLFPNIFKGLHIKKGKKRVTVRTGKNITVQFDRPCALQIDGETVLNVTQYQVIS